MEVEAVVAALVGLGALYLVLKPVLASQPSRPPVYEPLDPEETPRGVALAALKEIEFDRETGKLSDADYEFLKAKYTGQALDVMRAEKAAVTVGDVEAMIAARVQTLRSAAVPAPPSSRRVIVHSGLSAQALPTAPSATPLFDQDSPCRSALSSWIRPSSRPSRSSASPGPRRSRRRRSSRLSKGGTSSPAR
jgi:hypothetical protein